MHAERRESGALGQQSCLKGCSRSPAWTGKRHNAEVKELTWTVPSARAQAAKLRLPASSETWPATWSVQRTLVPELQDSTALGGMPGCRLLVACRHQQGIMPGQHVLCDLPGSRGNIRRNDRAVQVPSLGVGSTGMIVRWQGVLLTHAATQEECWHRGRHLCKPCVPHQNIYSCVAPLWGSPQGGACSHLQRLDVASQLHCYLQQRQQLLTLMGHTAQCTCCSHNSN